MKYLLDQEEFDALVPRKNFDARVAALAAAKEALLRLSSFTCIHERRARGGCGYCDDCPAFEIRHLCELPKEVSK